MGCSLPVSSVHGILQARILEWVAIPFSNPETEPRSPTLEADSLPSEQLNQSINRSDTFLWLCQFLKKKFKVFPNIKYQHDMFCGIYQFMFIDLSLIILILILHYNKTMFLRVPWVCLVRSYPVTSLHERHFPPVFITDRHWSYNSRLRVCTVFSSEWPYLILGLRQQELLLSTASAEMPSTL